MAFNNSFTPVWLDAGASVQWWFNNGGNQGLQIGAANCLSPDAMMIAESQANQLNDDGSVTYFVNITNNGPRDCFHNLNGGGVV
jgi:hypothetical protein